MVERLGYSTEFVAHDGREVVNAILGNVFSPDLIVMDYRMPIMNGIDAAERIRQNSPKIGILIASADDSIKESVEEAGMNFLQKPFSYRQFSESVKVALDNRSLTIEPER